MQIVSTLGGYRPTRRTSPYDNTHMIAQPAHSSAETYGKNGALPQVRQLKRNESMWCRFLKHVLACVTSWAWYLVHCGLIYLLIIVVLLVIAS